MQGGTAEGRASVAAGSRAVLIAAALVVVVLTACSSGGDPSPFAAAIRSTSTSPPTTTSGRDLPSSTFVPVPTGQAFPEVVGYDYDCGPDGRPAVIAEVEVSGPPGSRVRTLLRVETFGEEGRVTLGEVIVVLEPGYHEIPITLAIPPDLGDPATIYPDIVIETPPGADADSANQIELVLPPGVTCKVAPVPTPDPHEPRSPTVNPA
jgi:hypothetical protein